MLKAAIFDLDGTLLDTLHDLADSMNEALLEMGFPTHSTEQFCYFVGNGVHDLVRRTMPEECRTQQELVDQTTASYRAAYSKNWNRKSRPYDGILETIEELARRNVPMAVLSNKPQRFTELCMDHYFAAGLFRPVFGQRDHVNRKPDPAGAIEIAEMLGISPAEIGFVGDTNTDMHTARNAGMHPIGVTWGFRPETELVESGAGAIVHRPLELVALW
jgi:phosphoglycolate phosphatase